MTRDSSLSIQHMIGARLKALRQQASLTVLDLAAATGIHASRLSRIEQGRMLARPDEVAAVLVVVEASTREREELELLVDGSKQQVQHVTMPTPGSGGPSLEVLQQSAWGALEEVRRFRYAETALVPGFLEIEPYMRSLFRLPIEGSTTNRDRAEGEAAAAVRVRMQGQQMLFDAQRTFEFVLFESALDVAYGGASVMAAQCHHIVQLSFLPNVQVAIIPAGTPPVAVVTGGFRIFDDDWAQVEAGHGHIDLTARFQVDQFMATFEALRGTALHGDDARELVSRRGRWYAERAVLSGSDLQPEAGGAVIDVRS